MILLMVHADYSRWTMSTGHHNTVRLNLDSLNIFQAYIFALMVSMVSSPTSSVKCLLDELILIIFVYKMYKRMKKRALTIPYLYVV